MGVGLDFARRLRASRWASPGCWIEARPDDFARLRLAARALRALAQKGDRRAPPLAAGAPLPLLPSGPDGVRGAPSPSGTLRSHFSAGVRVRAKVPEALV